MAKKVTAIPATLNRFDSRPIAKVVKRRVAGYARVSTDSEEQATSYEAQVDYYTTYINGRDDWQFVGMYADEGITATNTKRRDGFNQMIEDALDGKIDLIITKSVSRFARNTVDSLQTVRTLKEKGVEIYFEKENIWTLDSKGELLITIMSSLAQEESRSISENTTWGKRKTFADGKATVAFKNFLGYDRGKNGEFIVNEEQAEVVRLIYKWFLSGYSHYKIGKKLTELGIPTPAGKKTWYPSSVLSILKNEKYKGDALLQKEYTTDFLTKKRKKNEGEVPQYYVTDHHEAIVTKEEFDKVQMEIERRKNMGRYSGVGIFSSKIKCGECGGWYGSKVWHSTDKYRKVIYRCNHKYESGCKCQTSHITEDELKDLFLKVSDNLYQGREGIIADTKVMMEMTCDTKKLESERDDYATKLNVVNEQMQMLIASNSRVAQDQNEYQRKYDELAQSYDALKKRYDQAVEQIQSKQAQAEQFKTFIATMEKAESATVFDESYWENLVDYVTITKENTVVFTIKNGQEIEIER